MIKILMVVGARPNFVKVASLLRAVDKNKIEYKIIHTGQHYDNNMSGAFFEGLQIPKPDYNLGIGSDTHAQQTARIMGGFESICYKENPNIVVVFGDVNSTLACSLVVSKMPDIKFAHVESGCRSFDRTMPEEVNRVITDHLSDYLFCTTEEAVGNLQLEGISDDKIYLVGDVMIDSLIHYSELIDKEIFPEKPYILFTLHRQSNTDNPTVLKNILETMNSLTLPVIFSIHPRTEKNIQQYDLYKYINNIRIVQPLDYLQFAAYMKNAEAVVTDSGGVQVESAFFGTPCITLRDNTEHVYTLHPGINTLVGTDSAKIRDACENIRVNDCWLNYTLQDGKASKRIMEILENVY